MGGHAVVADHALAHPQVPGAGDPQHGEVPARRMAAALRRDGGAAAEPFSRLRVVQDGVRRVNGVLRRAIPLLGGLPMPLDHGPHLGVTVHCRAPDVRWTGWTARTRDRHMSGRLEATPPWGTLAEACYSTEPGVREDAHLPAALERVQSHTATA